LSRLRFTYEEIELVKETSTAAAQEFQEYYEQFCKERNIDISKLNDEHRSRVDELYGKEKAIPDNQDTGEPNIDPSDDTTIALHDDPGAKQVKDQKELQMTADEKAVHEAFSKLFKQIALKIHPDKLLDKKMPNTERESLISMFRDANKAFEERKYYTLLDIAETLKISTPKNYTQQTRWMKKEIGSVEKELWVAKNSYNFIFSELETVEEKNQLIKSFIEQVFQIYID